MVRDLETVYAQPSVSSDYYKPVRDFLRGDMERTGERYRVEVVPVEHHWEAAHIPKGIYIARGWERQLDRKLNALFYEDENGPLTADAYRHWLDDLAVGYVAVPNSDLDYAGEAEARLIAGGLDYLQVAFQQLRLDRLPRDRAGAARRRRRGVREAEPAGLRPQRRGAPAAASSGSAGRPTGRSRRASGASRSRPAASPASRFPQAGPIRVGVDFSPLRALSGGQRCANKPPARSGWEEAVDSHRLRNGEPIRYP